MYEDDDDRPAPELSKDPATRAREKADEMALHGELAAVFEGPRKFDHEVLPGLDAGLARGVQQTVGRLEKAKSDNSPILPPAVAGEAAKLLALPEELGLARDAYHVHPRPGEVMIVRWIDGESVDSFYERLQAHFEAAFNALREDARSEEWRGDERTLAYLAALDAAADRDTAERYLRPLIRKHGLLVLSTLTVDEMDVLHLCDHLMGLPSAEVVGERNAPPEDGASHRDRAWFFKLFSLRGVRDGVEQMCFFTFLQKSDDSFDF